MVKLARIVDSIDVAGRRDERRPDAHLPRVSVSPSASSPLPSSTDACTGKPSLDGRALAPSANIRGSGAHQDRILFVSSVVCCAGGGARRSEPTGGPSVVEG